MAKHRIEIKLDTATVDALERVAEKIDEANSKMEQAQILLWESRRMLASVAERAPDSSKCRLNFS